MESNGKGVTREEQRIHDYTTGPIIWGDSLARTAKMPSTN